MNEEKRERSYSTMTEAELAAWDAEIDADFQRHMEAVRLAGRRKRGGWHIGGPWEFWVAVRSQTLNGAALTVAMYVYRQTVVRRRRTVKLVSSELIELKVDRSGRHKALRILEAAGLVRLHSPSARRAPEVELLWSPNSDSAVAE